jgi:hypothetical protein
MYPEFTPPPFRPGAHIEAWDGTHGIVHSISRDHTGTFYHLEGACLRQEEVKGVVQEEQEEK